ncbi:hypothetical protein ACIG56_07620 [Nocardia fusca]|uniref:hypothetical protein n=1 Tax=Nocardia fusca TaxID=941183 RepID=UPI0037C63709
MNHTPLVGAGVLERVEVVVGDAGVVDTSGDLEVVELAGLGVIVVLVATVSAVVVVLTGGVVVLTGGVVVVVVGTVVVAGSDVTVIVDGSADTVTVLGSAVMVTVDVSVGVAVTVTVDIDVEVTVPGSGTLNVAWTERLAVAEKLTLTDASVGFVERASVVIAVVDSGAVAVPVPGSVESAGGRAVSVSVAVSVPATSPGTETSLGAADVVFVCVFVRLVRLRTVPWSKAPMVGWHELFAGTGGLESVRTMSVIPIAVVTNAAVTPARDICRRNRSACRPDHRGIRGRGGSALISCSGTGSSLLSTVCIELLLSPSRCADRWNPVTTLRTALLVKSATTPPSPPENKPEYRILNSGSSAEHRSASSTVSPRRTARARHP